MAAELEIALVEELDAVLDRLLAWTDEDAHRADDERIVAVLQRFERFRNRLPLVDHALLEQLEQRQLADRLLAGTTARFLTSTLRISAGEAQRRLRASAALRPDSARPARWCRRPGRTWPPLSGPGR